MANEKKNLGHMSIDPMTGKTVYVKPGDKNPAEKREERKKEIISLLRQYVSDHSNGPMVEETDPMVILCNDAADMLQATVFKDYRFIEEVKLEKIMRRDRHPIEGDVARFLNSLVEKERETAKALVYDVLHSGLIETNSYHDQTNGEVITTAEMYVGVKNGKEPSLSEE